MLQPDIFVPEPDWKNLPVELLNDGLRHRVWHRSDSEYHQDCRRLAWKLHEFAKEKSMAWWGMLCIPRGGLVGAGYIGRELNIRLVETLSLKLYDDSKLSGKQVRSLLPLNPYFLEKAREYGRGLLIFDDVIDSGQTAAAIRHQVGPHMDNATLATVYAKQGAEHGVEMYETLVPQIPDPSGEVDPRIWIRHPWDLDYLHKDALIGAVGN